ncbi:MAG: branched-chain amino acid ABC transporter permease [Neomegalonema sp.]|nr:branched-chain amino acid ABC transporter permease [Neomegalonema sp.]
MRDLFIAVNAFFASSPFAAAILVSLIAIPALLLALFYFRKLRATQDPEDRKRLQIDAALFLGLAIVIELVLGYLGAAAGLGFIAIAACHALIALGLTMQWGYAGLFNAGVLGFTSLGAFGLVFTSMPVKEEFWRSDAAPMLGGALAIAVGAGVLTWLLARFGDGLGRRARGWAQAIVIIAGAVLSLQLLAPASEAIEAGPGYIGGLGLPPLLGWLVGGLLAAAAAYGIGKACLGLRSDYLAIATLGAAEIIRAVLKNEDWLTRGTLTVSPLPWPTPKQDGLLISAELARIGYSIVIALLIALYYLALTRAYKAPWGRMIRAIRDDEDAASAMGKDVDGRRLQIFVLGSAIMGVGGAALAGYSGTFDPTAYQPLNNTFIIWVMVIVGGAGNNIGAIFGAVLVYAIWSNSGALATALFEQIAAYGKLWFDWDAPRDFATRAIQMRVFLLGLVIVLVLRFAPRGLFPERPPRID